MSTTTSSATSVRRADSSSTTNYGWRLADLPQANETAPTIVSTFAAGGGSSMGYKRAGYRVMGANDIDQEMMENYTANLDSGTHIVAPIGELAKNKKLVDSWYGIDVLDGSPPCTSFSEIGRASC